MSRINTMTLNTTVKRISESTAARGSSGWMHSGVPQRKLLTPKKQQPTNDKSIKELERSASGLVLPRARGLRGLRIGPPRNKEWEYTIPCIKIERIKRGKHSTKNGQTGTRNGNVLR